MGWWPFFQPSCPIDTEWRDWVHERMHWLADQFTEERWHSATVIEPLAKFFPDPFTPTEDGARLLLNRVCAYMDVDPEQVELQIHEVLGAGPAGLYHKGEKHVISVDQKQLQDPLMLVATMAHELAHSRLLGENRVTGEEEDHEPLTDLATVFFGFGIFNANCVVRFGQWCRGQVSGWKAQSLGYLDERVFGYALGLWAFRRGEMKPSWMKHLRTGPKVTMRDTIAYLRSPSGQAFLTTVPPQAAVDPAT